MISTSNQTWWQDTVFYEIYISSFQDGNGDGIGDFAGLTSRLGYLQDLGVNGLWITPFYPSPKVDNGYDVADYFDVDPDFGTLADFDHFIEEAHRRGMKVIIDVVLNHVSTDHAWFREAASDPKSKYRDYFFFQDAPNGWSSFFGGSAWSKEPDGSQVYYHKFAPEQADLNWQNQAVRDDMKAMLRFWLDKGVDGFRFDVINFLSCDGIGAENPVDEQGKQIHLNDIDQLGIYPCVRELCGFVREYAAQKKTAYFLVGEVGDEALAKLAPYQGPDMLDVVFNFNLGSIDSFDICRVYQELKDMEKHLSGLPTIFFNSHDMARSMSRLCHENQAAAAALAALTLMAKGVSFLYFGEEIGMSNFIPGNIEEMKDIQAINHFNLAVSEGKNQRQAYGDALEKCRDKSRSYMSWNKSDFSGFSRSKPWIGAANVVHSPNVEDQRNDPESLWHWYQKLIFLCRDNPALAFGNYDHLSLDEKLLHLSRRWDDHIVHIHINFSREKKLIDRQNFREILTSRGISPCEPDYLPPFGVLITREIENAY
ncbi:alpha-amylase family glycosyl hydrolase [Paremcibacter congregatus]|nr:alpha-amylase family glycosyl hydrolase [Paremcibacter congregatus]QDE27956.1 glucohydrolase [Paremcibacter congregatus]